MTTNKEFDALLKASVNNDSVRFSGTMQKKHSNGHYTHLEEHIGEARAKLMHLR